jgi:hypothetical protein
MTDSICDILEASLCGVDTTGHSFSLSMLTCRAVHTLERQITHHTDEG